jgi:hypothetical protein
VSENANNPEMVLMVQCLDYATLDGALQNYFAWETKGGESYRKRMTAPPEILIIHLIRNRYGKNLRRKDRALVSFRETLAIMEFILGDEVPGEYHLKAIASHIGQKVSWSGGVSMPKHRRPGLHRI